MDFTPPSCKVFPLPWGGLENHPKGSGWVSCFDPLWSVLVRERQRVVASLYRIVFPQEFQCVAGVLSTLFCKRGCCSLSRTRKGKFGKQTCPHPVARYMGLPLLHCNLWRYEPLRLDGQTWITISVQERQADLQPWWTTITFEVRSCLWIQTDAQTERQRDRETERERERERDRQTDRQIDRQTDRTDKTDKTDETDETDETRRDRQDKTDKTEERDKTREDKTDKTNKQTQTDKQKKNMKTHACTHTHTPEERKKGGKETNEQSWPSLPLGHSPIPGMSLECPDSSPPCAQDRMQGIFQNAAGYTLFKQILRTLPDLTWYRSLWGPSSPKCARECPRVSPAFEKQGCPSECPMSNRTCPESVPGVLHTLGTLLGDTLRSPGPKGLLRHAVGHSPGHPGFQGHSWGLYRWGNFGLEGLMSHVGGFLWRPLKPHEWPFEFQNLGFQGL